MAKKKKRTLRDRDEDRHDLSAPRVLIVVEGGMVQEVLADGSVMVLVKDWDNIKEGDAAAFLATDFHHPDETVAPQKLVQERLCGVQRYVDRQRGGCDEANCGVGSTPTDSKKTDAAGRHVKTRRIAMQVRVEVPNDVSDARAATVVKRALDNGYDESQRMENKDDPDCCCLGRIRLLSMRPGRR